LTTTRRSRRKEPLYGEPALHIAAPASSRNGFWFFAMPDGKVESTFPGVALGLKSDVNGHRQG
jgi:hypothetical protein